MSFWQEVTFGVLMLVIGLFAEDWIDQWRGRKHDASRPDERDISRTDQADAAQGRQEDVQVTLSELVTKLRTAQSVMSRTNAHRILLGQCEAVILALVADLEAKQREPDAQS